MNTATCRCEVFPPPPCLPQESLQIVHCDFPTTDPFCLPGFVLEGCQCVKEALRECSSGILSSDKCTCTESLGSPLCIGSGCDLNSDSCSCEGKQEVIVFYILEYCMSASFRVEPWKCPLLHPRGLLWEY